MEFKVSFDQILKIVYSVDLEEMDARIDDYYYDAMKFDNFDADKDVCEMIAGYIERYGLKIPKNIEIKNIANRVLAYSNYRRNSDAHYFKFIEKYKNKVMDDFVNAEKTLYETEYLVKSGIYSERYDFNLNVEAIEWYIKFEGNLDALDALVMVCQREYDVEDLNVFREDYGNTYEERFLNGMSNLKEFENIFDTQNKIFESEDFSYLYGQFCSDDTDIEYEEFENWMQTIEAVEIFNL